MTPHTKLLKHTMNSWIRTSMPSMPSTQSIHTMHIMQTMTNTNSSVKNLSKDLDSSSSSSSSNYRLPKITLNPPLFKSKPSVTLAINELSNDLIKNHGRKVYKFGLGQSPFPVPRSMVESLKEYAAEKDYLPCKGLLQLRQEIANYLNRNGYRPQSQYDASDIVIGPGSKELLFAAQLVTNRTLQLPQGSWVSYEPQAFLLGRDIQWIESNFDKGYKLLPENIPSHISNLLILNYPNNPTGATYSSEELAKLAETFRDRDTIVISDEIYGEMHHEGNHVSLASHYPEGTIVSSGISKGWGAGGWRLGFFAFPKTLKWMQDAMETVASETFSSVSAPIQHAAIRAFQSSELNNEIAEYLTNSRSILRAIARLGYHQFIESGAKVIPPEGGFYLTLNLEPTKRVQHLLKENYFENQMKGSNSTTQDSNALLSQLFTTHMLQETGVAVLPMSSFGLKSNPFSIRLAYVDFDGARALDGLKAKLEKDPNYEIDENFLREYALPTLEGFDALSKWLRTTN